MIDLVVLLAQMCVAEVNFGAAAECMTMWSMMRDKASARGVRLDAQIADYNSIFRVRSDGSWLVRTSRARWIRGLGAEMREPEGWPPDLRWSYHVDDWLAIYAAATQFMYDAVPHPCPRADEYGGDCDDEIAACDPPRACWIRVRCGVTRQAYWSTDACASGRRVALPAARASDLARSPSRTRATLPPP